MALFDNGEPEEIFLYIQNFNLNLEAPGTLKSGTNIQYLCMLVRGEALHRFDTLSAEVVSATPENMTYIIIGLGTYFFPVNALSKKKRAMSCGMRKLNGLKVRHYADHLIEPN